MRILEVASGMPGWGGAEKYIMDLSPCLLERGHDLVIGCRAVSEIERRAKAARIPTIQLEMRRDSEWQRLPVFIRAMRGKFDVVHIHDYVDYIIPATAARLTRVPVVMTRHNPHPFRSRATAFLCSRVFYDRIIAVSEFIRRVLIESGVASNRIRVAKNGIDPARWQQLEENQIRNELHVPPDVFLVAAAGRLCAQKGFDVLVRAIGLTRERGLSVHCAIAGGGGEMGNLEKLRSELGLTDAVHLMGFRNDMPALFAAADAVAVPSTGAESFPYVILEAMASGRAVIGSRIGGIPELITPDVGYLTQAGDATGIADAIEDLVLHPDKKHAMGRSGRSRVAEFSLGSMVSNVEAVFHELLGSQRKNRNRLAQSQA